MHVSVPWVVWSPQSLLFLSLFSFPRRGFEIFSSLFSEDTSEMHQRQCNPSSMKVSAKVSEFQLLRLRNRYLLRKLWKTTKCKRKRQNRSSFFEEKDSVENNQLDNQPIIKEKAVGKEMACFFSYFRCLSTCVCTGWGWQGLPTLSFGCRPSPNIQKATTTLQGKPFLLY